MIDPLSRARTRNLIVYRNHNSSWLCVPGRDLLTLGVGDSISSTSHLSADYAFLSESTYDAVKYVNACVEADWLLRIDNQLLTTELQVMVKNTGLYHPHWITYPLAMGSLLSIHGEPMRVINQTNFFWYVALLGHTRITHRIDKINPYQHIAPPDREFIP